MFATPTWVRWTFGITIATLIVVAPSVCYRAVWGHGKRLREVEAGVLYRSGQLTTEGFSDAVTRYGIRTIVNLQDEYPDPTLRDNYLNISKTSEVELCKRLDVRYVHIAPDMVSRQKLGEERPKAIDQFLAVMDDPSNYPVLMHCKAGLHRTGVVAAVYRMEYQGWTNQTALTECIAHGFGRFAATSANDYISQYILSYTPGQRRKVAAGN